MKFHYDKQAEISQTDAHEKNKAFFEEIFFKKLAQYLVLQSYKFSRSNSGLMKSYGKGSTEAKFTQVLFRSINFL